MEYKDLKDKKEGDLHKLLAESRNKLRELRFKDANAQLKNVREIRGVRNTIARILTAFKAKKAEAAKEVEGKEAK
jgi:ribosomal protein L29